MTNAYKQIQITNENIGAIAANEYLPYGRVTRRINAPYNCCNTFVVTSSTDNTVVLNDLGFYKVTYSLTAEAGAVGDVTIGLVVNGTTVYSVSVAAAAEGDSVNVTLPYTIRACSNCTAAPETSPVSLQIQNTGVALTAGTSNIIIEKI